jgi:hypothetical protein
MNMDTMVPKIAVRILRSAVVSPSAGNRSL